MTRSGPATHRGARVPRRLQIKKLICAKSRAAIPQRPRACGMGSSGPRPAVGLVFEQIARLTIEHGANPGERIESYASHLAGFEQRNVLLGDADALSELLRPHLAFGEHHVEVDDNGHRSHDP